VTSGVTLILGDSFVDRWKEKEKQPSFISAIKGMSKPSQGLKQQINTVTQRIDMQKHKLDNALSRFKKRDEVLFKRVVKALSERDTLRANVLADELSEIRKVEKMLMHATLALESVSLRLNTVSELGEVVTMLAPAAGVLNNIRSGMTGLFPEADSELENIGGLLTEIVSATNQSIAMPSNVGTASAETEKILKEAELAAEQKLKEQLPEVDAAVSMSEKTSVET
jgi:division protein CdvB (Snf7/Vps24/ESCRT-III family)